MRRFHAITRRLGARIAGGFATSLLAVLLVGAAAWYQADALLSTMRWVEHTDEVLEATDVVREDLDDIESGTRGYLLSGREEFLAPYQRGQRELDEHLTRLRALVADNPSQIELAQRLSDLARQRATLAAALVEHSRANPGAVAEDKAGQTTMQQAMSVATQLQAIETRLLTERKATAERTAHNTFVFIGLSFVGLIALLFGGTWLLTRSLTRPLSQLTEVATRIGQGEAPRFPPHRDDEIGQVVEALEQMAKLRHEAEARTRLLLDDASEAYLLLAPDGRLVDVNRSACALLGYTRDELLELRNVDLVPAEELADLAAMRASMKASGNATVYERTLVRKDGTRVPVEMSAKIFADGRMQAFGHDITERRHREAAQRFLVQLGAVASGSLDRRETLSVIAQEVVGFLGDVCLLDLLAGDRFNREVVACADPAKFELAEALKPFPVDARRLRVAYPDLTALRSTLIERVTPELIRSAALNPEHQRALEALDPRSTMAVPLISRGAFIGVLTLASTRPDRVYTRADVELVEEVARRAALAIDNARHYQQSLDAIRNRDEVLHVVAHDLRNPLNAAALLASTLVRRHAEEERRKHSRRVVDAIKHALASGNRLIEDLLDVTRLEGGAGLPLRKTNQPPAELVGEAIELLKPSAISAAVRLRAELEALPAGLQVNVDRDRIVRVLANLIGNSVKFTPRDGEVRVTGVLRRDEVCLAVTDTGPGIAAADLERVFQRFWQAKRDRGGGVGLGLSIARTIVEQHGGKLWAESEDGKGATFIFTLPVVAIPQATVLMANQR